MKCIKNKERNDIMKRNILISANTLCIGGIEKSLVTLLKNFDYNRYDIKLVLEEKKGVFLSEIPKDVVVSEYKTSNSKNVLVRKIINFSKRLVFCFKNYNNQVLETLQEQQELNNSLQTLDLTNLEKAISLLSKYQSYLESITSLMKSQNKTIKANEYQKQVDNNLKQISEKEKQATSAWNKYLIAKQLLH